MSIVADDFVSETIEKNYGINHVVVCELLQSKYSDVYKITTITKKFIFKLYRHETKSVDAINFESEFMRHLFLNNINAVKNLMAKLDNDFKLQLFSTLIELL
jgi:Ser/Thr protein kinase RdoA (MazF antagonist)